MKTRVNKQGYSVLSQLDRKGHQIYFHRLIAEKMFGGLLPREMSVHHLDGHKHNNLETNLMICSHSYHRTQHRQIDAMKACGVSWFMKCTICGEYDNPKNMYVCNGKKFYARHRECMRDLQRTAYKADPKRFCAKQRKYHAQRLEKDNG